MSMKTFSIIIPHYNNATDLSRCLDSIPVRDDVEVIIVDDNSDPSEVDFDHFPGLDRADTKVVFSKAEKGKGPGFARNLGLEMASGEWIIFSDSDDYFLPEFESALKLYRDSDADVIFFRCKKRNLEGNILDYHMVNELLDEAERSGKPDPISYGFPCPWGKFIRRSFLVANHIEFQQITGGDDILFSLQIAACLNNYAISDISLYCVVDRPGSLTRNNSWRGFGSYVKACCCAYKIVPETKRKLVYSWTASWWGRMWAENRIAALALLPNVACSMGFCRSLHCFKKATKVARWDWTKN